MDTLKKEIEFVFPIESNPTENVKPVSLVQEWADRDSGLQVALKELTERLGNLETKIQSVVQCSSAPDGPERRKRARGGVPSDLSKTGRG